MIKLVVVFCLFLSNVVIAEHNIFHNSESIMILPIIEVIDGDTIRGALTLPVPLNKISVRVLNLDTPESTRRAKCESERLFGIKVKELTKLKFEKSKFMILRNFKYGTYAGRIVSDVEIDGIDVRTFMINNGYGKDYDGRNKPSWCD